MLAREQGVEDQMIEAIYTANHEKNECLSDFKVLLAAAEQAGVRGAEEMLASDWGKEETLAKIHEYLRMGINAVPVIIIQGQQPIMGAPEKEFLAEKIAQALGMSARSTGEVEAAAL
jgi:predicted DsbA family dithiol-disulfide isomerase